MNDWFLLEGADDIISPALAFYPERIAKNLRQMIKVAGSAERLRPHVKTHKCREILDLQVAAGISAFKSATLAEAELVARAGAKDILLAYPLAGPARRGFLELRERYPEIRFSALIDHPDQLAAWEKTGTPVDFFLDLNVGMSRTGILPANADALLKKLMASHHNFRGWHAYDGHLRAVDVAERRATVKDAFLPVEALIKRTGTQNKELVCGGSITFPLHAEIPGRRLSPGTTLLWDHGYGSRFPDVPMEPAATLLTRVISKPGPNLICVDLGHKAVGSEMEVMSAYFPQIPEARKVVHSEEHLVLEVPNADEWPIDSVLYGIPYHICPTVNLHARAYLSDSAPGQPEFWEVAARHRNYTSA